VPISGDPNLLKLLPSTYLMTTFSGSVANSESCKSPMSFPTVGTLMSRSSFNQNDSRRDEP